MGYQKKITVEVCCGSVEDCIVAQKCKADRIELNYALELDGLTPSIATLRRAKELVNIPIYCMVRPRGFGFYYSEEHFQVMKMEAKDLLENGADGIVFGFLDEKGEIDQKRTMEMVQMIHPKKAIFHKAIDYTKDLFASIEQLIECGVDRVLTSGQGSTPNIQILRELQERYGNQIEILIGGGVREHNVEEIIKKTGVCQIHTSAKSQKIDSSIANTELGREACRYFVTDDSLLQKIIDKVRAIEEGV